ncbi:hypothetical protein EDD11_007004 [Mortierella claussenii]|nr:hypothetical protein EDD11_007004 [Mortierella claussenii]
MPTARCLLKFVERKPIIFHKEDQDHFQERITQQKWNITKIAGGPFTRYALAYPRRVFGKTLLVSESNDAVDPKYVAFLNEDEPDTIQAWKFAIID